MKLLNTADLAVGLEICPDGYAGNIFIGANFEARKVDELSSLYWKREEEELLCRMYKARTPAWVMARRLGRSLGAIQTKACRLGLTAKLPQRAFVLPECEVRRQRRKTDECRQEERSTEERQRFRRLLMLLLWCKLKTGKSAKEVVNAVLQDGDRTRLNGTSQSEPECGVNWGYFDKGGSEECLNRWCPPLPELF